MSKAGYVRGIGFAMVTAGLWGILPILMKIALREFPAGNIVWFRFTFAFLVLFGLLSLRKEKPSLIIKRPPWLGLLAGMCLAANYYYFLRGVETSSPSNAGILIQFAPVLVVIIGVTVFGERFTGKQALGLGLASVGFVLFYRDQSVHVVDIARYSTAFFYIVIAGVTWAMYLTFQKRLSHEFAAQHLNLLIYGTAALVLPVTVQWPAFEGHNWPSWALMVVLGINTLLAYGSLAEAVKFIPLSMISVIISLNPFITLAVMQVLPQWFPEWLEPEVIGVLGFTGAVVAIAGVILVVRQPPASEKSG